MAASLRRFAPCACAAAFTSTTWALAEPAPPRVGLVGTGWALKVQLPRFRESGLPVAALYSRDLARAKALCAEHRIAGAYDSVPAMAQTVDLVSVVCPTHERKRLTLEAIAEGKDVLVDKPCALDASEAAAMLAAAEAKGVRHFMDFELRCVPALVEAKRLIADGAIGDVRFIDFRCLGNFGFLEPTNPQFSHWNSKACGGGGFSAVGTHFTDLTRWLLDDEVAAASAIEAPLVEAIAGEKVTADGYCSAQLRLARKSDVGVHLTISARCPGRDFENRLTVVGTRGTFDFDFLDSTLTVSSLGEGAPRVVSDKGNAWSEVGTAGLATKLASGDVDGCATLFDGLAVQRVTDAVHASAETGGAWVGVGAAAHDDLTIRAVRERQAAFAKARDWCGAGVRRIAARRANCNSPFTCRDQFHTPRNILTAMVGEVGELAECFQWKGEVARGLPEFSAKEKVHVGEEMSDVFVYLVRLADVCGVDLESAITRKIDLNAKKYPADKARGSSAKYTAYQNKD